MKKLYLGVVLLNILLLLIASCGTSTSSGFSEKDIDAMTMEEKLAAIEEEVKRNPPKEI